jgi:Zn-dependent protease with chaperone function
VKSPKPFFFGLLFLSGLFLLMVVLGQRMHTPFSSTFAPLFSLAGRTFKTADRLMSRVIPVGEIDEKTMGDAFAARMVGGGRSEDRRYLDTLVAEVGKLGSKPFTYRVFIVEGAPNAFSLPGGVVIATTELMDTLTSEAQLVSVLAHEVGPN